MGSQIDLWVCPTCDVLQGIEVKKVDGGLVFNCVNCGVQLQSSQISFLDPILALTVIDYLYEKLPSEIHGDIRFTWLSNKTVGIIFEFSESEVIEIVNFDIKSLIEDEMADDLDLTTTVFFE